MTPKGVNQFIENQLCMKKPQLMSFWKKIGCIKEYTILLVWFCMQKAILKGVLNLSPFSS